jgi:tRNA 2-selenouridine synthase
MAITKIDIEKFVELAAQNIVLDVRSPSEYAHANMPNAISLPLFDDAERKIVGTTYKQESREAAIKIGLKFFGPKMTAMVEQVEELATKQNAANKSKDEAFANINNKTTVLVHCWRGGMRSAGVAWLLDLYGFKVYTLVGGYKAYRNWVLQQFEKPYQLKVLGGYTGSGKTDLLKVLQKQNELMIDLEGIAHHKGSAFGNLGEPAQPSQEMFENKLAMELVKLSNKKTNQPIWLEDESMRIGLVNIPKAFFAQMRLAPLCFLDIPFAERLKHIVQGYGQHKQDELISTILRIQKKLGGLETKTAINHLVEKEIEPAFSILLKYYDKLYLKGLHNREELKEQLQNIVCDSVDAKLNANKLLQVNANAIA